MWHVCLLTMCIKLYCCRAEQLLVVFSSVLFEHLYFSGDELVCVFHITGAADRKFEAITDCPSAH